MIGDLLRGEDGSLPLALTAVLIVAGLTAVATGTMIFGMKETRRDEHFTQALHVADTALNRMVTLVETRDMESKFCLGTPPPDLPNYAGPCTASERLPAPAGYTGQAVPDEDVDEWVVTVRGVVQGRMRTLQSRIPLRSPFILSPVARTSLNLQGGNHADSYRSGAFSLTGTGQFTARPYHEYLDEYNAITDRTRKGIFTTEGPLTLNGQSFAQSDGAQIWFARNPGYQGNNYVSSSLPGATGVCLGVTATCDGHNVARDPSKPLGDGNRRMDYVRDRLKLPPVRVPWQPTEHFDGDGAVLEPSRKANGQIIPYVFRSAKLYSTTTIQGTPDNPTIIYLTGEVTAPPHARINFVADPLEPQLLRPRPAGSLLIYSSMRGNAVHFPTGVQFAGGIYAPTGAFNGGSQGELFGALVADVVRTQGGWKFHYDETTAELDGADLRATDWVEVGS